MLCFLRVSISVDITYPFRLSSVSTGALNILITVTLKSASYALIPMPYQSLVLMLASFLQIVIFFLAVLRTLRLVVVVDEGQTYFIG